VVPLIAVLVVIVLVFYVFFSSAVVDGQSMMPTLNNGDYLLITHGASTLNRGDIVVTSVLEKTGPVELVKRVIALPGDTIEIKDDVAWVNGVAEPARGQFVSPAFSVSRGAYVVPSGYVYVMGDNRPVSEDSRYLGPVPLSGLKGRAVLVFAPMTRFKLVN
jgi:signal peptidase I